jgi:hypothetical protein
MTEDLHNDIDDLFRSGLAGREDTPSPNVWASISKGLPPTPPSAAPPSAPDLTPTPPAVGGWTSTIIFKGFIGAAILAVVGTVAYFMTSAEKPAVKPEAPQIRMESAEIQQPLNDDMLADDAPEVASAGNRSDQPQALIAERKASGKTLIETEKTGNKPPVANIPDEKPGSGNQNRSIAFVQTPAVVQPEDTKEDARPKKMVSGITKSATDKKADPSSTLRLSSESFRTNPPKPDTRQTVPSSEKPPVQASGIPQQIKHRAKVTVERRDRSSDKKAAPSFRIPSSGSLFGLSLPGMKTSEESSPAAAKQGSAPLKRNDWRSKIYLTPVISLNMTTMDVEENESFRPRIGREHIEFRETEDTRTTLSPGLIVGYAITPRISVQTGITELKNNISVSPKQIRAVRDRDGKVRYRMDCSSGSYFLDPKAGTSPSIGDSLRIASSEIKMRYLSIPLSVRVNFGNDRLRLFATAGTDINILASKQTSTSLSASSREKVNPVRSEGTRKQYINGTLGAGIEIRAGKRLGIMLMPQYRFPLGNMNEDGPVLTYPKTFSITSGVRIGF